LNEQTIDGRHQNLREKGTNRQGRAEEERVSPLSSQRNLVSWNDPMHGVIMERNGKKPRGEQLDFHFSRSYVTVTKGKKELGV